MVSSLVVCSWGEDPWVGGGSIQREGHDAPSYGGQGQRDGRNEAAHAATVGRVPGAAGR